MSIRARIGLGFALCAAIVLALGTLALRGAHSQVEADRLVSHTEKVLDKVERALSLLLDTETSVRGFGLTGDEIFLEPHALAKQRLPDEIRELRALVSDNPPQSERAGALESFARARLEVSEHIIEARRRGALDQAAAVALTRRGKAITDEARRIIAQMEEEENRLLAERSATAAAQARATIDGIVVASLASILVAALGTVLLGRSISAPVRALSLGAARVGAGDLDQRIEVRRRDELGALAEAFNRMIEQRREAALENARLYRQVTAEGERLRTLLQEKNVLLHEIHHRVKNNLQVLASLLDLQARSLPDAASREALRDSRSRVRSIALAHEALYRSEDLGAVDLDAYLAGLARHLAGVYDASARHVAIAVRAPGVQLGIDAAMHSGLLVNELVSNALKHAFPDGRAGRIEIGVKRDGEALLLRVADDGVGFPEGLDFRGARSLGLQLVCSLTEQLGGEVTLDRGAGTAFTVRFPAGRE